MKLWRVRVWPKDRYDGSLEFDIVAETSSEAAKSAARAFREKVELVHKAEERDVTLVETMSSGTTKTHYGTGEWVKRLFSKR